MNKGIIKQIAINEKGELSIKVNLDLNCTINGKKYNVFIVNNNSTPPQAELIEADTFFDFKNANVLIGLQNRKCEFTFEKGNITQIVIEEQD